MALRVVSVKSSGGDYSSLNAALVGEVGNLITLDRQLRIDCYAFTDSTPAVASAYTTDATHFITIRAVTDHGGAWNVSAYVNNGVSVGAFVLSVSGPYTVVDGLQLDVAAGGYGIASSDDGIVFRTLIVRSADRGAIYGIGTSSVVATVVNCLAYGFQGTDGFNNGIGFVSFGASGTFYNCTSVNNINGFKTSGSLLKNNLSQSNSTADFSDGAPNANNQTNCSSDGTATGTGSRTSQTATFVNTGSGTEDYHLQAGDTAARRFGTALDTTLTFPFSYDIDRSIRYGSWDIGADQISVYTSEAANDVMLRGVPSDTNPNDVRLYPFGADPNSGTVTAASEASNDAVSNERLAATVTASSEGAGAAVGDERLTATITASSEASSAAVGDARLTATITGSSEASGAAVGDERITSTITGSSEASGAATGDERSVATITASSEGAGSLAGDERFIATVAGSSEAFSDAVGDAREAGSISGSSESFADAVGSARSVGAAAASSEAFADVVGVTRITGTVTASSEASANALGESRIASIEVSGGGNKGHWYEPRERVWTTRITGRIEAGSGASIEAHGTEHIGGQVTADSRTTLDALGVPRIVGRVRASSEDAGVISAEITEPWQIEDEELLVLLMAGADMEMV